MGLDIELVCIRGGKSHGSGLLARYGKGHPFG